MITLTAVLMLVAILAVVWVALFIKGVARLNKERTR